MQLKKTNGWALFLFMTSVYSCSQPSTNTSTVATPNTKYTAYTITTLGAKLILVSRNTTEVPYRTCLVNK